MTKLYRARFALHSGGILYKMIKATDMMIAMWSAVNYMEKMIGTDAVRETSVTETSPRLPAEIAANEIIFNNPEPCGAIAMAARQIC